MRFGIIASWWACGALVGCSPYVYSGDVTAFSGKAAAIEAAYQDNDNNIKVEQRLLDRLTWTRTRPALSLGPGCKVSRGHDGPPCALVEKGSKAQTSLVAFVAPPPPKEQTEDICTLGRDAQSPSEMPAPTKATVGRLTPLHRADVFKALDRYAAALAAITNAKDREQFDAAAAQVSAAIGSLTGSAGAAAGVGVAAAPMAQAATNLALWLVGQSLDYQRLEELRMATQKACEPVHALAIAVEFILDEQRSKRLQGLEGLLAEKVLTVNPAPERPRLTDQAYAAGTDDAQATVAVFETVRAIDPAELAAALNKTHDALVAAVSNNDGQLDALIKSLQEFDDQVRNLVAAGKAAGLSVQKQ